MNTPEHIDGPEDLPEGAVFVFGANTQGIHGTGSAFTAIQKFDAVYGQASGRQGQSYGIITTDLQNGRGSYPLESIDKNIDQFLEYADDHWDEMFVVTKVGTFRAGYTIDQIGDLWKGKWIPPNVILPKEFVDGDD